MKRFLAALVLFTAVISLGAAVTSYAAGGNFWDQWAQGKANGLIPACKTNVLAVGGDDILQATVDTYCSLSPGEYKSYINPAAKSVYDVRGDKYPDGKTGVLVFPKIGAVFTTEHKDGKPIYDVVSIKDGKSIASKEKGHPLNPETCAKCHISFDNACRGAVCGNRM